jgi:predicted metal-dependent phosphoesterase TrpH
VYADLHVHTDVSDGTMSLDEVPAAAVRAGVSVVGLTDHDRVHPGIEAPVVRRDADGETVTLVRGIELRVDAGFSRVDLLGYGAERTSDLDATVETIQRNRKKRGRAIVEAVETRLGVDLEVEVREGMGRPHVARAVADHPDVDMNFRDAFAELIGDDGPCYVAREIPSFEEGRAVLSAACGLVGLAHPLRYDDPEAALALCADLDAVERSYPYDFPADLDPVERAVEDYDLLVTGGSDAHDDRLGLAGLTRSEFAPVREQLPWSPGKV